MNELIVSPGKKPLSPQFRQLAYGSIVILAATSIVVRSWHAVDPPARTAVEAFNNQFVDGGGCFENESFDPSIAAVDETADTLIIYPTVASNAFSEALVGNLLPAFIEFSVQRLMGGEVVITPVETTAEYIATVCD